MKIAFVGKGGSGKSTVTSLYASLLAKTQPVLLIDADINMHLGEALGFSEETLSTLPFLGSHGKAIKEYLRGTNPRIADAKKIIKTTPPGKGSRLVFVTESDPVLTTYALKKDNLLLMAAGTLQEEDRGAYCYHKYSGVVEVVLNHLLDTEKDRVIIDMTAGTDAFSTGLFATFDLTCMVVEPTKKSTGVFAQYAQLAAEFDIHLCAIGNKVRDEEDIDFLKTELGDSLLTYFYEDSHVYDFEKGKVEQLSHKALRQENRKALDSIEAKVQHTPKDWDAFYTRLCTLHTNNAHTWANSMHGTDFTQQIDPEFTYTSYLSHS